MTAVALQDKPSWWSRLWDGPACYERDTYDQDQEIRRVAQDPIALADLSAQAVRRINKMMIADINESKRRVLEAAQAYCERADGLILAFQERAEPMLDVMNTYASDVAAATEMIDRCPIKRRTEHDPD